MTQCQGPTLRNSVESPPDTPEKVQLTQNSYFRSIMLGDKAPGVRHGYEYRNPMNAFVL
jgi:hypothetical protein